MPRWAAQLSAPLLALLALPRCWWAAAAPGLSLAAPPLEEPRLPGYPASWPDDFGCSAWSVEHWDTSKRPLNTSNFKCNCTTIYLDGEVRVLALDFSGPCVLVGGTFLEANQDGLRSTVSVVSESSVVAFVNTTFECAHLSSAAAPGTSVHLVGARFHQPGRCPKAFRQTRDTSAIQLSGCPKCTIRDSVFSGFRSSVGGAIFLEDGAMDVFNTTFYNCSGGLVSNNDGGGAVFARRSKLTLRNCTFDRNHAVRSKGGAISAKDSPLHIVGVLFKGNEAHLEGGSVYADWSHTFAVTLQLVEIIGCTILGSYGRGGGAVAVGGLLVLRDTLFQNVVSRGSGGGVLMRGHAKSLRAERLTVRSSNAVLDGGFLSMMDGGRARLADVTVDGSFSSSFGGFAAFRHLNSLRLQRLRISNVRGSTGGAVHVENSYGPSYFNTVTIERSIAKTGGSISLQYSDFVNLKHIQISGSSAMENGGALRLESCKVTADNFTVNSSSSVLQGGVIYATQSEITLRSLRVGSVVSELGGGFLYGIQCKITMYHAMFETCHPNWMEIGKGLLELHQVRLHEVRGWFMRLEDVNVTMSDVSGTCNVGTEFSNSTADGWGCKECLRSEGVFKSSIERPRACFLCPPNSRGVLDHGCLCGRGFVNVDQHARQCVSCADNRVMCPDAEDEARACENLTAGVDGERPPRALGCGPGEWCRTCWPVPGHWKLDHVAKGAVECPFRPGCNRTCAGPCATGYEGPMCMACRQGWYRPGRHSPCHPCATRGQRLWAALCLGLAASAAVALRAERVWRAVRAAGDWTRRNTSYMSQKLQLLIFTLQVYSTLSLLRSPSVPVVEYLSVRCSIFNFDWLASVYFGRCELQCSEYERYSVLLLQTSAVLLVCIPVARRLDIDLVKLLLFVYNYTVMAVARSSVSMFLCDDSASHLTSSTYLVGDYREECYTASHAQFVRAAGSVLSLWCVAVPCAMFVRLWCQRRRLDPEVPPTVRFTTRTHRNRPMVSMELPRDFGVAVMSFSKALMAQLARSDGLPHTSGSDKGVDVVRWPAGQAPCPDAVEALCETAHSTDSAASQQRKLLKIGLRAVEEKKDPRLLSYSGLYRNYNPDKWYYEIVGILGRVGYAAVPLVPADIQDCAGLLLSVFLQLSCICTPFRRSSDSCMAAVCYFSMAVLFGMRVQGVQPECDTTDMRADWQTSIKCVFKHAHDVIALLSFATPTACFLIFAVKAYLLPSRRSLWAAENSRGEFEEEFCRSHLGHQGLQPPGPSSRGEFEEAVAAAGAEFCRSHSSSSRSLSSSPCSSPASRGRRTQREIELAPPGFCEGWS